MSKFHKGEILRHAESGYLGKFLEYDGTGSARVEIASRQGCGGYAFGSVAVVLPQGLERTNELRVGSPVWQVDLNKRVYPKDERGFVLKGCHPYERGYLREFSVLIEDAMHYSVGYERAGKPFAVGKIPKVKTDVGRGNFLTALEVEDLVWDKAHRVELASMVGRTATADQLRAIAGVLGYDTSLRDPDPFPG